MKKIQLKTRLLCAAFVLAAFAFASCTNDAPDTAPDQGDDLNPDETPAETFTLTTVELASFAGNAGRVTYATDTRAGDDNAQNPLQLVASIANPSKNDDSYFTVEPGGRYMSATSIFYDVAHSKYYVTYHMQGNNYNTSLNTDTAGAIQSFSFDDSNNTVTLDKGFRAQTPSKLDFDFNHIYFDNTDNRILTVGHCVNDGNRKNTNAIVGVFDPAGTYTYATVKTDKATGELHDSDDAAEVNCIVRTNDAPTQSGGKTYGWNIYLVATRRGMAALHADQENLFKPYLNDNGDNYFIATPGSSKYIAATGTSSWYGLLYLSEEHTGDVAYDTKSQARIAKLSVNTSLDNGLGHIQGWETPFTHLDPTADIRDFYSQFELPKEITPIDGKNTLCILGSSEFYAALGANGMYYKNHDAGEGIKRFDSRPVNCVAVDSPLNYSGHSEKGYLYVANGSKLTILERSTLKEVASYQAPSKDKDGNAIASSANFITVRKVDDNNEKYSVRYVAVAFGQEGVKIFKFTPPAQ